MASYVEDPWPRSRPEEPAPWEAPEEPEPPRQLEETAPALETWAALMSWRDATLAGLGAVVAYAIAAGVWDWSDTAAMLAAAPSASIFAVKLFFRTERGRRAAERVRAEQQAR